MTTRRALGFVLVVGLVAALVVSIGAAPGVAASEDCETDVDRTLCIEEFAVSDEELVVGDTTEFTATVTNPGAETTTGVVLLYTAGPDNETNAYQLDRVTLEPNETRTISRAINASTPGTHTLQMTILDPATSQQLDASEPRSVEVYESTPARLGGPIDRTEIALVALVGSILGMGAIGYRYLGN